MAWGLLAAGCAAALLGIYALQAQAATMVLRPNANFLVTNWANTGGSTHYVSVSEVTPNTTTYISSATSNANALFDITNPAVSGTITSVQVTVMARETGGNSARVLRTLISNGTTTVQGATAHNPINNATYGTFSDTFATNPSGGAWTWSDLTNLKVGCVLGTGGTNTHRVTNIYVTVTYTPATLTVAQGSDAGRPSAKVFRTQGADQVADELTLTAAGGPMTVTQVVVRGLDTVGALLTDVPGVRLFRDDGATVGQWDGSDTQLGATRVFSGNASGSTATFGGLSLSIPAGTTEKVWIVYTLGAAAADGHIVGSQVNVGDVTATGGTVTQGANIVSAGTTAGQTIQVDAAAPAADTSDPLDGAVLTGTIKTISGTASDGTGSGLSSVQVRIARSDGNYWNGAGWTGTETWNNASGTTNWTYAWSLDAGQNNGPSTYAITARATDNVALAGTDPTPVTGVKVDNVAPTIVSASPLDATHVDVVFSEALQAGSIAGTDFTIAGLTVSGAGLQAANTVRLTTSSQAPSQGYSVQCNASNVLDLAGNANAFASADFSGYLPPGVLTVAQGSDAGRPSAKVFRTQGADQVADELTLSASNRPLILTQVVVRGLDTVGALLTDVPGVRLFRDDGATVGQWDGSDTQLGATRVFSGNASGSTATFGGLSLSIPAGTTEKVWIVYTLGAAAADGHIVGSQVNVGDVTATGGTVTQGANIVSAGTTAGQTIQVDAAAPAADTSDPLDGAVLTGTIKTISGTASDGTGSGLSSVQVRIARSDGNYWNGAGWTGTETWNNASGTTNWTYAWSLDAGQNNGPSTYAITARATDNVALAGTDPTPVTGVKVDNVSPSAVSASAAGSATVEVVFDEALESASVQPTDFTIVGLVVQEAVLQGDSRTVRLTTSVQAPGSPYTVQVVSSSVADVHGNLNLGSSAGFFGYGGAVDVRPPSVPASVVAASGVVAPVIATVSWQASTDNVGVSGYRVWRAIRAQGPFESIGTTSGVQFADKNGVPGQDYYYSVSAYDATGNESSASQASGPARATWTQTPHAVFTSQTNYCSWCHSVHEAVGSNLMRDTGGTIQTESSVCYNCHDGRGQGENIKDGPTNSFALATGHTLEETAAAGDLTNSCSDCHSVHQDSVRLPMLPRSTINGAVVTTDTAGVPDTSWCLVCHTDSTDWFGPGYPSMATPTRDATGYPISGTFPGPAVYGDPVKNPHASIPSSETAFRSEGSCLYCHAAHRGANSYDGLNGAFRPTTPGTLALDQTQGTYAASCFYCHGGAAPSELTTAPANIKQFVTYAGPDAGHRIETSGGVLPVGAPIPCYECHNPHGSARGNSSLIADTRGASLETTSVAGVRQFCFTCHTTSDTRRGWDSASTTYTVVQPSDSVLGLSRTAGVLALQTRIGHAEADTLSCYACHGSDYGIDGRNVHNPEATIDVTPPITVADLQATYSSPATITLTAADNPGGWGVMATHYILDGGAETTGTVVAVSGEGSHTLEFWSVDVAGNVETPHETGTFIIDQTAPTTTSDARALYASSATITLTATDNAGGSGVDATHYILDGGTDTTGTLVAVSAVGTHSLEFWSVDVAGNVETPHTTVTLLIDPIAPTTTSDARPTYSNSATITLTATDNAGGSGVASTHYVLDGGADTTGTVVTASTVGTHTIEFWSVDVAANEEAPHETVSFTITDSIAPTTTSDAQPTYSNSATITLTATDNAGGSGVASTHYVVDGGADTTGTVVTVSTVGAHTIEFWSVDVAGNVETPHNTATFTITDTIAPVTASDNQFAYVNSATITLTATDNAGGSGVASTHYVLDGGAETTGTVVTVSTVGSHALEFWSVDVAGNVETPHNAVAFAIGDSIAPATASDVQPTYPNSATIILTATDNAGGSGVASTHYVLDSGAETTGTAVTASTVGTHTIEFWSVDVAGNVETPHTTVSFTITDSIAPTTTSDAQSTYSNSATIALTATDNAGGSGVASTLYVLDGGSETTGTVVTVSAAGSHSLEFWSVDVAGNVETPHNTVSFTITDSIAPTTASDAQPTYSNSATITLTATDNAGGSGVASTHYVVDGGAETTGTAVTASTVGTHTLEFWSVDVGGNVETPHNTAAFAIGDSIAPATASDVQFAYVNSATISLTATDNAGGSGVAQTHYVLDSGAETTGTVITVSTAGSHTLEFWSVDVAGNVETPHTTVSFTITDSIAPTTASDAQPTYSNSATITLTATDNAGGSGVASTHYVLDSGAETTGTVVTVSAAGSHTLEFWSVDVAGNVETPHTTVSFTITDSIAPTTASDAQPTYSNSATITLTATDNAGGSGVASTHYVLDSGAETTGTVVTVSAAGSHTLEFWSVDVAGNVETPHNTAAFAIGDSIAPATASDVQFAYVNSATISLTATDNAGGSGVAQTHYVLDSGAETTGTVITVSTAGSHTLEFWSVDVAGNVETPHTTVSFTITDSIAPATASDAQPTYSNSATITLTATDNAGGSGVASTHYVLDSGAETTGTVVTVSAAGSHTLEFWSVDVAGNVETPHNTVSFSITDSVAPTTTSDAQPSYTGQATITLTVIDNPDGSGAASTHYVLDGGSEATGTVVTVSTVGSHTLEFWSVDVDGNVETPHNTVSFLIDPTAPTTTSDAQPTYAGQATIALTATDNPGGSGVDATHYILDGDAEATGTLVTVSAAGSHTLEFWSVDVAGNVEAPHSTVSFLIDPTAPTTTSDAQAAYANSATITLTATDNPGGSGVASTHYVLDGGTQATGTLVTVSTAGSHTLEFWSVDLAGNSETPHNTVSFTITDSIAPTTNSDVHAMYIGPAMITFTAIDNTGGSGVDATHYILDGGTETSGTVVGVPTAGSHTLEFWSVDIAGNVETPHNSMSFLIDPTAPTTTSDAQPTYAGQATIALTATDNPGGSGVASTHYVVDGGADTTGTVVTVSTAGSHTLEFWSVDAAGNVEIPHTSVSFLIDPTAPATISDAQPTYAGQATITLTATDNTGGSGVDATHYILDGGADTTGTVITVSTAGSHTLEFWSVDAAGNVETPHGTVAFTVVDWTAPTTTSDAQPTYTDSATITLTAADDPGGSGVAATHYILDGGADTTGTVVTVSTAGSHALEFWSIDVAGNEETHTAVAFTITPGDHTAPTTTSDAQAIYPATATVTLTGVDDPGGSGVDATHYILDGGADAIGSVVSVSAAGNHTLEFWSVDAAGNVETPHKSVGFLIDPTAPTTTSDAQAAYANSATIALTATDNPGGSGVASTHYVLDGGADTTGTVVTVSTAGSHTLEFWSVDAAGNVETPHTTVTFSITDSIAPATASDAQAAYANSATITLSASDNPGGSGMASTHYVLDGGADTTGTVVTVSTAGSHTLEFWSVDAAGNVETPHTTVTFSITDTVAPATASDAQPTYSDSATITLSASDNPGGSGVASTHYVADGGAETAGTVVTMSTAGSHTLEFWSVDVAGNVEMHDTATFTITDSIAPATASDAEFAYMDSATIALIPTDNIGGSGVAETRYILDSGAEATGTSVTVSTAGSHTLEFWSADAAGNVETPHNTVTFVIGDSIAPTTTSDAELAYAGSATITLVATDNPGGSGVAETHYVLDGGSATTGTVVSVSTTGSHTLEFWSVDVSGNAETPHTTVGFLIN